MSKSGCGEGRGGLDTTAGFRPRLWGMCPHRGGLDAIARPRARLWGLGVLAGLWLAAAALAAPLAQNVVIISMDGLRPDAIAGRMPVLERFMAGGATTLQARTVLPSVTLVAHASMVTGVRPDVHRVTWNTERAKGMLQASTIFELASRHGLSTVVIAAKKKLSQLVPDQQSTPFVHSGWTSMSVAKGASKVLRERRPRLSLIHLTDTDEAGHNSGFMSPEYLAAAERTDRALALVLVSLEQAGMRAGTLVIVTSDHGGRGKRHGSDRPEDTTIPWIASGPGVRCGVVLTRPVSIVDTAATALWALGLPVPEGMSGRVVAEAFEGR